MPWQRLEILIGINGDAIHIQSVNTLKLGCNWVAVILITSLNFFGHLCPLFRSWGSDPGSV